MLINDHRPRGRIYDHGGYKETRNNAASHHHSHSHAHSTVAMHFWGHVSGHGGGGDEEKEVEEYVKADIRLRRAAIGVLCMKMWY